MKMTESNTPRMASSQRDQQYHRRGYYNALLLLCLLVSLGLAIGVSQSFGKHTDESGIPAKTVTLFYTMLVFALYFWMVVSRNRFVRIGVVRWCACDHCRKTVSAAQFDSLESSNRLTPKTQHHSSLWAALAILGTGAAVRFLFDALMYTHCLVKLPEEQPSELLLYSLSLVNAIGSLGIVIFQLRFFRIYDRATFKRLDMFNYIFSAAIGFNLWAWIGFTIKPLETLKFPKLTLRCKVNGSAILDFQENLYTYIEPFLVEFITVTTSALFQIWGCMSKNDNCDEGDNVVVSRMHAIDQSADLWKDEDDDNCQLLTSASRVHSSIQINMRSDLLTSPLTSDHIYRAQQHAHDFNQPHQEDPTSSFQGIFAYIKQHRIVVLVAILSAILYALFNGLLVAHTVFKTALSPMARECLESYLMVIFFLPSTCWMLHRLIRINANSFKLRQFDSSDSLLLFTALWAFMVDIIHLIAALGRIEYDTGYAVASILVSIFFILQTWIQTNFIITVSQARNLTSNDPGIIPCLLYLMIVNVAEWFFIAFIHGFNSPKQLREIAPIESAWFGEEVVRVILVTVFPVLALYRFHSALLVYEVLKDSEAIGNP